MSYITLALCGVIFIVSVSVVPTEARITSSKPCEVLPTKTRNHCNIEYESRPRIKHTIRYAYHWDLRKCVPLYWWTDEQRCSVGPDENNFSSEKQCIDECAGWA